MALKSVKKKEKVVLPDKCGPSDLAALYAEKFGTTKTDAEEAIRNSVDVICEALTLGSSVSFLGQFALSVGERPAKQGRNPRTGEAMEIPAAKVVKFKAGANLKKSVNQ